jgi:hypothetical protein
MVLSNTGYKEGHKSDRRTEKKGTVFCWGVWSSLSQ